MVTRPDSKKARLKRHTRVRSKISGTAECPRLDVFRSLQNIYAQLIDDVNGVTLVSASTTEKDFKDYGGTLTLRKQSAKSWQKEPQKRTSKTLFLTAAVTYITAELLLSPKAPVRAASTSKKGEQRNGL